MLTFGSLFALARGLATAGQAGRRLLLPQLRLVQCDSRLDVALQREGLVVQQGRACCVDGE